MGGQVNLAKAQIDDETIEGYLGTDKYTVEYATVTSIKGNYIYLSNDSKRKITDEDLDRYSVGAGVYLAIPEGEDTGLIIIADEWEYVGSHEVIGLE